MEQNISIRTINTSPTELTGLNTLTILNSSSTENISISSDGGSISLGTSQTLTLNASTGFTLPTIRLTGTDLNASVITS
tara:strand:- start:1046 stop:1282 length:237 start_codon:yes stop_codon:yes gene_type:complete